MIRRPITLTLLLSVLLALAGCSETLDPDPLVILGTPNQDWYIGTESSTELGIDGGVGPYTATLSNAPAWMAVEFNENRFRPGFFVRGVPGLSGAGVTSPDLLPKVYKAIRVSVTDGVRVAESEFEIKVLANAPLTTVSDVTEATNEPRPVQQIRDPETANTIEQDVPFCMLGQDGELLFDENDVEYWSDLVALLERQEQGQRLTATELERLADNFGGARPRLTWIELAISSPLVDDAIFDWKIRPADPANPLAKILDPGEDMLISVPDAEGNLLDLSQGRVRLAAGQTRCPVLVLLNDDTEAEPAEFLGLDFQNASEHDYLPDFIGLTRRVLDNEPLPTFDRPRGVVSEAEPGLAPVRWTPDSGARVPGTLHRMRVALADMPPQDTTTGHTAVVRMAVDESLSTATLDVIQDASEVATASADILLDVSPPWLDFVDGAVEIRFFEEGEGEARAFVLERELWFYAVGDADDPALIDEVLTLEFEDSPTVLEGGDTYQLWVNEWTQDLTIGLSAAQRLVDIETNTDGGLYVGLEILDASPPRAEIRLYDRSGVEATRLRIPFTHPSMRFVDFAVREPAQDQVSDPTREYLQEIVVGLSTEALVAAPYDPADEVNLGGKDVVLQHYSRLNRVDGFLLDWARQYGTVWDDVLTGVAYLGRSQIAFSGITEGGFPEFDNIGGTDGMVVVTDNEGQSVLERTYGGKRNDGFLTVTEGSSSRPLFGGYSNAVDTAEDATDKFTLIADFNDDGRLRLTGEYSGFGVAEVRTLRTVTRGLVSGMQIYRQAPVEGSIFYEPDPGVAITFGNSPIRTLVSQRFNSEEADWFGDVDITGVQFFAGGATEGSLFEDSQNAGGRDAWLASYDLVQPDPTSSVREFQRIWERQDGTGFAETVSQISTTAFARAYSATVREIGGGGEIVIQPFAHTDGRVLTRPQGATGP